MKGRKLVPDIKLDFGVKTPRGNKDIFIRNFNRSKNYVFIRYKYNNNYIFHVTNLKTSTSYDVLKGFNTKWTTDPVVLHPFNMDQDEMFFVSWSHELREGVIDGITEESNPVLFIVKMKF